jgi:DnaK suppressor protein
MGKAKSSRVVKPKPKSGKEIKKGSQASSAKLSKVAKPVKNEIKKKISIAITPPKHLSAEMLRVRARLIQMLSDMRKDIDHEVRGASERDLAHINDTSDMASDAADGDLALRIAESETFEASEIERAIEKIDTGTYGRCEVCNKVIGGDRLQFLPFATLCIECQKLAEIRKRSEAEELGDLDEGSAEDSENN